MTGVHLLEGLSNGMFRAKPPAMQCNALAPPREKAGMAGMGKREEGAPDLDPAVAATPGRAVSDAGWSGSASATYGWRQ